MEVLQHHLLKAGGPAGVHNRDEAGKGVPARRIEPGRVLPVQPGGAAGGVQGGGTVSRAGAHIVPQGGDHGDPGNVHAFQRGQKALRVRRKTVPDAAVIHERDPVRSLDLKGKLGAAAVLELLQRAGCVGQKSAAVQQQRCRRLRSRLRIGGLGPRLLWDRLSRLRVLDLQLDVSGVLRRLAFLRLFFLLPKGKTEAVGGEHRRVLQEKENGYAYHDQQQQDQQDDLDPVPPCPAGASVTVIIGHSRSPFMKSGDGKLSGKGAGHQALTSSVTGASTLGARRLTISLRGQTVAHRPQLTHLL